MRVAGLTTEQLLLGARLTVGTKRTIAGVELQAWLEGLASTGILECTDGGWRPTPRGARWLREVFPNEQELAA